jgi:hypothetical protein
MFSVFVSLCSDVFVSQIAFCFGLVPNFANMQNVKGSFMCNVLFFYEKIRKSFFQKSFHHISTLISV